MKQLLSLAVAGVAFAAMSQPIYAKPEKEKAGRGGGMGGGRAEVRQRAVQQPSRVMQQPARTANIQKSVTQAPRTQVRSQARVGTPNRAITRTQPSVAFGGQTRAERRERTVAIDRTDFRRGDFRRGDGDWDRLRFRRPPVTTWRDWDHDQIYSWDNHRWHWYNNAWVIVGASPDYMYYDEPVASTYTYSTGSIVADVQRELAREGYDPGPIDGVMGGQTRSAIAAFQRDIGLAATGHIDSVLLDALDLR